MVPQTQDMVSIQNLQHPDTLYWILVLILNKYFKKYINMQTYFIRFIEHSEWPLKLRTWGVFKIFNILRDDLSVTDEKTLKHRTMLI